MYFNIYSLYKNILSKTSLVERKHLLSLLTEDSYTTAITDVVALLLLKNYILNPLQKSSSYMLIENENTVDLKKAVLPS